jgi:hypothetical protein
MSALRRESAAGRAADHDRSHAGTSMTFGACKVASIAIVSQQALGRCRWRRIAEAGEGLSCNTKGSVRAGL